MHIVAILLLAILIIWLVVRRRPPNSGKPAAIDPEELSLSKKAILKIAAISGHQPDQRFLLPEEVALVLGLDPKAAESLFRRMAQDHWIRFQRSHLSGNKKGFKLTIVGVEVAANFEKEQRPKYKVDEGAHF